MGERIAIDEILAGLVAFDTTSHRTNAPLVDFVCELIEGPGTTIERLERDGKINLVARRGPRRDDRAGLVLCGHTDTVPAEEPEWTHDPFTLSRNDDNFSGRGSCDMKGFLALAIDRFLDLRDNGLEAPLALLFTCDEEVGSKGAQWLVEEPGVVDSLPRQVLIGEPTQLAAIRLHKGHLRGSLELRGIPAHSGYPQRGVNAVTAAGEALVALKRLQAELRRDPPPSGAHFPTVPYEVINPAVIQGGSAVNVVPDRCRIDFGIRLLPGSDSGALLERVSACLEALELDAAWTLDVANLSPALETPEEAPLYRELASLLRQDHSPAVAFSSDAGVLSQAGLDCVLFGPGSIEVAHKPNEYLPRAELATAGATLDRLIERFCRERP